MIKRQSGREDLRHQRATDRRRFNETPPRRLDPGLTVQIVLDQTHRNPGSQLDSVIQISPFDFAHIREDHPFALAIDLIAGRVVQTQHDVLGRHNRRFPVGREQHVV